MAMTYLPSGYDMNMGGAPTGGFTLGQLLMPNYLGGRPWEENGAAAIMLDPADIEGSFRSQTGYDLRGAIRNLAPGFAIPNGPITVDMLENVRVDPTQQRAPASDFELIPSLIAAIGSGAIVGGFGQPGGGLLGELGNYFKGLGGDGITSTISSGANPTQVAGSSFFEGATPGLDLGPNNLWSGAYEAAGNPALVGEALGTGAAPWWQGLPGVSGLENLGTGAPYGNVLNEGSGFWDTLARGAKGLLGGSGGTGGLFGPTGAGEFSLSKLLGAVGPGIGGYLASNAQADAYRDIANKQLGEGKWARDMLENSYKDPNAYLQGEGKTFLDDAAKRQAYALSTGGNPIGSGTQMTQMMSDAYARNAGALGTYRGGLTAAGYGVPYQAGSQAQLSAVGQQGAGYNALGSIGSGINNIFNPQPTAAQMLADLLKQSGKINLE